MEVFRTVTATLASAASLTDAIQVGSPREKVYALLPSLSTNAATEIYGSYDGTTYARCVNGTTGSLTVAVSGTTGWVEIPFRFPYLKIHTTGAVDNGASYTIVFAD